MSTGRMGRRGDCWDTACAETFFKTLRAELIRGKIYRSREEAGEEIFKYVEVLYNRKRLHSYLGYLTPLLVYRSGLSPSGADGRSKPE